MVMNSFKNCKTLILIQLITYLTYLSSEVATFEAVANAENKPGSCTIFKYVGVNDLSINDIVVKSATSNKACIKARFMLAIKVEAVLEKANKESSDNTTTESSEPSTIVLGYLPLDSVTNVEESCPSEPNASENEQKGELAKEKTVEPEELDMIVSFECGKLAFSFKREQYFYLSSIKGVVNLDANTIREFVSEKPMFFTSDLSHHFIFNELIEVSSSAKTKAFLLTANFYNSEFEAFRNTTSRDFIRPPDDKSRPFLT